MKMDPWTTQYGQTSSVSSSNANSRQYTSNTLANITPVNDTNYRLSKVDCTTSSVTLRPIPALLENPTSSWHPVKSNKIDFDELLNGGAPDSFMKRRNIQPENTTWWTDEQQQKISNISNNNNTGTKGRDSIRSNNHWSPSKRSTKASTEDAFHASWSAGKDARSTEYVAGSQVPFGTWYEGGDYEADILRAAASMASVGTEKSDRNTFSEYGKSITVVAMPDEEYGSSPPNGQNLTYSNLSVPIASKRRLPPISLLASKADASVSGHTNGVFTSSVSPSSCLSYSPGHPFSATDLSGCDPYFQTNASSYDMPEAPYQVATSDFNCLNNMYQMAGNDEFLLHPKQDVYQNLTPVVQNMDEHLHLDGRNNSEPIHRLKATRHKLTQRRLLDSLYQRKASSSLAIESSKAHAESRKRKSPEVSSHLVPDNIDQEPDTEESRTKKRLESNERERMRMHQLNDAFQGLRDICPHVKNGRKLSKIETLTLARNYILSLTEMIVNLEGKSNDGETPPPHNLSSHAAQGREFLEVSIKQENNKALSPASSCGVPSEQVRPQLRRSNSTPSNRSTDCKHPTQGQPIAGLADSSLSSSADHISTNSSQASNENPYLYGVATSSSLVGHDFESMFELNDGREIFSTQ